MVPYFQIPAIVLGGVSIGPLALAIVAGAFLVHYRALARSERTGRDTAQMARLSVFAAVFGLVGAHLFDAVYEPWYVLRGWGSILNLWQGISALGAVAGVLMGWTVYWVWSGIRFATAVAMLDTGAYCFPLGCAVMRAGCFLVHDHVGSHTNHWLGVRFPDGARWDVGLLEVVFWLVMATLFRVVDEKRRPSGFYLGLFLVSYSLFRLAVDPLRVDQTFHVGISVDAWAAMVLIPVGLVFWGLGRRNGRDGTTRKMATACGANGVGWDYGHLSKLWRFRGSPE